MIYRYRAIPLPGSNVNAAVGELSADSPADVRSSLRRIGLLAVDVRPARRRIGLQYIPLAPLLHRHLRSRRRGVKSEILDGLATMLEAGIPLDESIATLAGSRSKARTLLAELREGVRGGGSLSSAIEAQPGWFDAAEVAMCRAGEVSGELPGVLRTLAERHHRSGELMAKVAQALAYPAIVLVVGLGVVIFLSTKTLPDLASILHSAQIPTPRLTTVVMAFGQGLAGWWWLLVFAAILAAAAALALPRLARRRGTEIPAWLRPPAVLRQAQLAEALLSLAELLRVGVPMTEALRVTAPSAGGPGSGRLRSLLIGAADRLEGGERISRALDDGLYFDGELIRLIAVGESAGELDEILAHVGERTRRRARRTIDRLASLLEPAVILLLAAMVGVVVMAAVLPLIRLQEVL